ncbi:hypothetical protein K4F52_000972 [Lecanicillium sp. MT-2017a]|nr:hypothetical protein K4F52_000972 [Lecanicillium sp. MT-2017a]
MASPLPAPAAGGWNGNSQQTPSNQPDESGVQLRPMGLKVHYTFDKEAKVNCLARYPQTLQIQTIPIDEVNTIGVVDLRVCVQAVSECSPELAGMDCDYTIYAVDYSEPDMPQVGQGMLSWALDTLIRGDMSQPPKLVTGRVTKNLLGVFGGGNKETLEVKLRLASSPKPQWSTDNFDMQAMTPGGTSEWNSFIQSNPQIGQQQHVSRVASPAMSQGLPVTMDRRDSFGPAAQPIAPAGEVQRVAPTPVDPNSVPNAQGGSSRPSSRASNRAPRKRQPTGRPRGRPRKKPLEGNTSGYEDGTEGEDGPTKKRAKITKAERSTTNPFSGGPESLRVTASTSGSLRTLRPIGPNSEAGQGNHLQEVPRAPTPVPNGPIFPGRTLKPRRESTLSQKPASYTDARQPLSPSQDDGRSPESLAATPAYSEDSPGYIGSSPPVQRATPFLRSSPPPSSPVLPPMPPAELPQDASFAADNGDTTMLGDEAFQTAQQAVTKYQQQQLAHKKGKEMRNAHGVPVQVFKMQNGPGGQQDLVHICSYNSQQQQPQHQQQLEQPSLPPLKQNKHRPIAAKPAPKKERVPSPPGMAPTPPPTTDAPEKPISPAPLETAQPSIENNDSLKTSPDMPAAEPASEAPVAERPASQPATQVPTARPKKPLARSQSAGPLLLPAMPASEPAGPSALSQSTSATKESDAATFRLPNAARRGTFSEVAPLPVPASDPVGPTPSTQAAKLSLPETAVTPSEPICPPPSSPPASRSNKNIVKKHAIKQRLEEAILNGEMPPYCTNCGAIETPTWRKIWIQEHEGPPPEDIEFSEKPGKITAIEILKRDDDNKPTLHRIIKKGLTHGEDKSSWQELLLCNPCGIWLSKCKTHRPRERWDKDSERRKRGVGRSKKSRSKVDLVINPTSEAYMHTDAMGPMEPSSPKPGNLSVAGADGLVREASHTSGSSADNNGNMETQSVPGTTHSRASEAGDAKSPADAALDEALGGTKRLLFPSPRKDGSPKVLGNVDVNIVVTSECRDKSIAAGKENTAVVDSGEKDADDLEALFRSPAVARPSTPTQGSKAAGTSEPFKTPTRPTPNHRPITRSVSRSLRTVRSVSSPSQLALMQATPSKTPRTSGMTVRRSPRNHLPNVDIFDTPITRSINQLLSEPNGFGLDSELDLNHLPQLEGNHDVLLDFGNLLSTDGIMPSSPPRGSSLSFDYEASWAQWSMDAQPHDNE